jgi:hypothetical protein
MNRPNRYQPIHKGLRAALFDATVLVARTEFADAGEATVAARTVAMRRSAPTCRSARCGAGGSSCRSAVG